MPAGQTNVQDLVLRFSAETEKLQRGLRLVQRTSETTGRKSAKSTDRLKKSLNGVSAAAKRAGGALVAAFAGGALLRGIRQTFSAMNDLQTSAEGIGTTVENIQELQFAFTAAGADASKVVKVLTDFNKRIGEAKSNLGTLLPFLKEYNISLDNANGTTKTSNQLFDEVADKLAGMTDVTQRAALGNAAFGRTWVDVVAALQDGSKGLAEVRQEARDAGAVISGELVKAAAEADAQFNVLLLTIGQVFKRGIVASAQDLGIIDRTAVAEVTRELEKQQKVLSDALDKRSKFREGSRLDRKNKQLIEETNQSLLDLHNTLIDLTTVQEISTDATSSGTTEFADMDHQLNLLAVTLSKLKRAGLTDFDAVGKSIGAAVKELKLFGEGPSDFQLDVVNQFADVFSDVALNIQDADDAVKNLIASIGRLIIQEFALAAAKKVGSAIFGIPFAGGGVMTSGGAMPLNKYAGGGVASSPQVAIFGEGARPEAFVPLPDGRSIPVTVKTPGGSKGGGTIVNQTNHFGGGIERDMAALLTGFMPMIVEATKTAVFQEMGGVRT